MVNILIDRTVFLRFMLIVGSLRGACVLFPVNGIGLKNGARTPGLSPLKAFSTYGFNDLFTVLRVKSGERGAITWIFSRSSVYCLKDTTDRHKMGPSNSIILKRGW